MYELNNMQIPNEILIKYMQIYLTEEELKFKKYKIK